MALIIQEGFDVNSPAPIDKRLLVDRVTGTTASLVSLTKGYNYKNMYVWVREEKAFYYLINSPAEGGATSSDWAKLSTGVGGSASAINLSEVAFGTGTGITSSNNFKITTPSGGEFNTTLIFGSGSTISPNSRFASIISGCCNTIGYKSCQGVIIGGCKNCLTIANNSAIIGGLCNCVCYFSRYAPIVGGYKNTLSRYSCSSSIVGGAVNTLSCRSNYSSIVGGACNTLIFSSRSSSILGGYKNTLSGLSVFLGTSSNSSIIGGQSNILCNNSCNSSIIGGQSNLLCNNSCNSVILGGVGLTLSNECSVVLVPTLKIATASNVNASRILVWDTDNYVKFRDVSTIGGVGGSVAINTDEISFGTGTGLTSSKFFTFVTSNPTLIFGSGSTICSSSRLSAIIGGCSNTIGTASCNSGIFGGCNNNLGTSSQSVMIGGQCNRLFGTTTNSTNHSSIIGGYKNTLSATSSHASIVGGGKNTLCFSNFSSIVGGGGNCLCNTNFSSIIGGQSNTLCNNSCNSAIIGGIGLTLSNECSVVLVPTLKIATASNVNASRILVWDTDNYVKFRDVSTIGGVGGSVAINTDEVGFGTGTGITSSSNFTFTRSNTTLIFGSGSTIASSSECSAIIGGSGNCIGTASCNSGIFGGRSNNLCLSKRASIIGGYSNNLCFSNFSSIVGGCNNTISNTNFSSIIGGGKNTLCFSNFSSIVGGCNNTISNTNFSSIIGGQSNTLCNNSCNSAIIGGIGLTLSNECSVVYVPNLKIASASNNDSATKILVWDTNNYVKYRDVSTIGGGGGSISLKSNAGLTNSGVTYGTTYNTTVPELTKVPSVRPDATGSSFSLSWLIGLTAGYFSQKNIVEVLDMILFPTVPFIYTLPSVTSISSLPVLFNTLQSVSSSDYTSNITTNFNKGNAFATASTYKWYCSNGTGFSQVGTSVSSSADSATTAALISFSASTPKSYCICSSVDHQAGTPQLDSSGNIQPGAPSAGTKFSNSCNFSIIFPYYFGTVSDACTSITAANIISCGTPQVAQTANGIIVNFNTQNAQTKGFLATPKSPVNQTVVTYAKWTETTNDQNYGDIPGALFPTISTVTGVLVNGISQTYSVYLFSQGSQTPGPFCFTT